MTTLGKLVRRPSHAYTMKVACQLLGNLKIVPYFPYHVLLLLSSSAFVGARTSITATGTSQGNSSQQQQPSNSRLATAAAASSAAVYPPASNPPELADTQQWSKTKLVEAVPGWARGHAREVKHLAAWADSLFDDSTCVPQKYTSLL